MAYSAARRAARRFHSRPTVSLSLVNLIKAVASQLIVWHHFSIYGPMSDALGPELGPLTDLLADHGRLAVQAFLVVGGFLAARTILDPPTENVGRRIGQRFQRLVYPYAAALALAIVAAAVARILIAHPTIPDAPTPAQVLAHLLLLHDIVDAEALSAGVWYVAIDFQLFAALCLIGGVARRHALAWCAALTLLSLFWFNRIGWLDDWGVYFFGAYGLGVAAAWIVRQPARSRWLALMAAVVALALAIDWRSRILVAGAVAWLLALTAGHLDLPKTANRAIRYLAATSYPVFLLHYPMLLAVGAVTHRVWPGQREANAVGLLLAWGLTMIGAHWQHRLIERRFAAPANG